MSVSQCKGLTFFELLIVLSIVSILLLVAVPSLHHWLLANQVGSVMSRFRSSVRVARSMAISQHRTIQFCGSGDQKNCDGQWGRGQIIVDVDSQRVLRVYPRLAKGARLVWRSNFKRNDRLVFTADGFSKGQQGTFYYCPKHQDSRYARGLVVSQSGRVRALADKAKVMNACLSCVRHSC